jgi:hypothetical protein
MSKAADRPKSRHIGLHGAGTRRPFGGRRIRGYAKAQNIPVIDCPAGES